tara:strand:- start:47 stop:634 length:588 start_codon:yes stop_codon:yes gene_type:complete
MRYGQLYALAIPEPKLIQDTIEFVDISKMEKASTESERVDPAREARLAAKGKSARNANVSFINEKSVLDRWLSVAQSVNKQIGWDLELDAMENLQYGEYNQEQYYDWHVDQHKVPYADGRIRKCSFSVFLNDDYEGGEFDLETGSPKQENRIETFTKLPINQMIFFQSEFWHRVRPVTKGVRKSIVGWVLGPKFK